MPKKILGSPSAPPAMGPYSAATEANGFVFLSGVVPIDPKTGAKATGTIADETHQVMVNIGSILRDNGLDYDDIVKTTIFLTDIHDFAAVNEVYAEYVGVAKPARSTIQAGALPGDFGIEIECIAAR